MKYTEFNNNQTEDGKMNNTTVIYRNKKVSYNQLLCMIAFELVQSKKYKNRESAITAIKENGYFYFS